MTSFRLVNPYVKGPVKTTATAKSPIFAAKKVYAGIADLFSNNVPSFFFSIQDQKNGKLYHFESNERKSGKEISYTIRSVSMSAKGEKRLRAIISEKDKQIGAGANDAITTTSPILLMPFDYYFYVVGVNLYQILSDFPVTNVFVPPFLDTVVVYQQLILV